MGRLPAGAEETSGRGRRSRGALCLVCSRAFSGRWRGGTRREARRPPPANPPSRGPGPRGAVGRPQAPPSRQGPTGLLRWRPRFPPASGWGWGAPPQTSGSREPPPPPPPCVWSLGTGVPRDVLLVVSLSRRLPGPSERASGVFSTLGEGWGPCDPRGPAGRRADAPGAGRRDRLSFGNRLRRRRGAGGGGGRGGLGSRRVGPRPSRRADCAPRRWKRAVVFFFLSRFLKFKLVCEFRLSKEGRGPVSL